MARRPSIPQRKNTTLPDAYDWVAVVRDYTQRIQDGPVRDADLAGQQHINDIAQRIERALLDLNLVLPGGQIDRVYDHVTTPLRTYLALIVVPRALWAEPEKRPILRRKKNNSSSRRTARGPRRDASGRFAKAF